MWLSKQGNTTQQQTEYATDKSKSRWISNSCVELNEAILHTLWFHLNEVQEQTKLILGDRN